MADDTVSRLIERGNDLLAGSAAGAGAFLDALEGLHPRDLVRFDERSRSYFSGLQRSRISGLRDAAQLVWSVLALVSADGRERERAAKEAPFTPLTTRLLALRCVDWVPQVRDAALDRLDGCPPAVLVEAFPLAEQLVRERARGGVLAALLDARFTDADLRAATLSPDPLTRRAAWRRLNDRGATTPDELRTLAARDGDVIVRGLAARALGRLPDHERRALAEVLVRDRVGWVAVPALAALVALDGAAPIIGALTARSAAVRRAARDWAAVRGVDARSVYLERLENDPLDATAVTSLAEMGDGQDADLFRRMLGDERARVRAAGLRALARVDRPAARRAAVDALRAGAAGRVTWAAADILRDHAPSGDEIQVLTRIALDPSRTPGQRLRVLSLLRRARWAHLAALLEVRNAARDEELRRRLDIEVDSWVASSRRIARPPDPDVRARVERLLPTLDAARQREIAFVLRTSS
jgi:hypothetical protein